MHEGFVFEVVDVYGHRKINFSCPEETYDLLMFIGAMRRFMISAVYRKDGMIAAAASTQKLSLIAGKYVGKDDPAFDRARSKTNEIADYLRSHGPFEPHRLGLEDLEYTTMDKLMKKLEDRFKPE